MGGPRPMDKQQPPRRISGNGNSLSAPKGANNSLVKAMAGTKNLGMFGNATHEDYDSDGAKSTCSTASNVSNMTTMSARSSTQPNTARQNSNSSSAGSHSSSIHYSIDAACTID